MIKLLHSGMFFPSCHTHLEAIGTDLAGSDPQTFFIRNRERQDKLILWQCNIYQRQVYLFNMLLMILMLVIIILVSSVQSFNYNDNVIASSSDHGDILLTNVSSGESSDPLTGNDDSQVKSFV